MLVHGPMQLVLHGSKKLLCGSSIAVIIYTGGVYFFYFFIKDLFGGAYIPYTIQQLLEIVGLVAGFQAFINSCFFNP